MQPYHGHPHRYCCPPNATPSHSIKTSQLAMFDNHELTSSGPYSSINFTIEPLVEPERTAALWAGYYALGQPTEPAPFPEFRMYNERNLACNIAQEADAIDSFARLHGMQQDLHTIQESKVGYSPDTGGPAYFEPDTLVARSLQDPIFALAEIKMGGEQYDGYMIIIRALSHAQMSLRFHRLPKGRRAPTLRGCMVLQIPATSPQSAYDYYVSFPWSNDEQRAFTAAYHEAHAAYSELLLLQKQVKDNVELSALRQGEPLLTAIRTAAEMVWEAAAGAMWGMAHNRSWQSRSADPQARRLSLRKFRSVFTDGNTHFSVAANAPDTRTAGKCTLMYSEVDIGHRLTHYLNATLLLNQDVVH